jgi:hypothetical protein
VGLVVAVVGVVAEDDGFDCVERGVAGPVASFNQPLLFSQDWIIERVRDVPRIHVLRRRKHLLTTFHLSP